MFQTTAAILACDDSGCVMWTKQIEICWDCVSNMPDKHNRGAVNEKQACRGTNKLDFMESCWTASNPAWRWDCFNSLNLFKIAGFHWREVFLKSLAVRQERRKAIADLMLPICRPSSNIMNWRLKLPEHPGLPLAVQAWLSKTGAIATEMLKRYGEVNEASIHHKEVQSIVEMCK